MFWKFLKPSAQRGEATLQTASATESTIQLPLAFLQKLIPVGDLPIDELQTLPISLKNFNAGEIIFNRGDSAEQLLYLYQGSVFLESANGNGYQIDDAVFKACYPLSNQGEHACTAFAKTAVSIVYLPGNTLQRSSSAAEEHNPLINPGEVPNALRGSSFFRGFSETCRQENLNVPSLPDVALRLRSAFQQDLGIADAAKIVNLDPLIAAKLIQVANSPLYRTANPIGSSHDAINRLGFKTAQNLVTSISLNNLFRSNNKRLHGLVQQLWKQSIQVSSLSYTLAALTGQINPDEAMLAGLIFNIGALPVITFAETLSENSYQPNELMDTITLLQGSIGMHILEKWHFPEALRRIPVDSSHWYHDQAETLQLSDIVILARFHSQLGQANAQKLPPLNTLPAFAKLGNRGLTPEMSLQILQDARQQIAEALSFFRV